MSHFTHSIKKHCMVVVVFLSSCFPRLRKSRAVGFLAGTFKRARATAIKRQDRKWGAAPYKYSPGSSGSSLVICIVDAQYCTHLLTDEH